LSGNKLSAISSNFKVTGVSRPPKKATTFLPILSSKLSVAAKPENPYNDNDNLEIKRE